MMAVLMLCFSANMICTGVNVQSGRYGLAGFTASVAVFCLVGIIERLR